MTKLPPWLSAGQTIAWIAFRRATPTADWEDPSKPPAVVWEDLLPETHDWRAPRGLLLAALEARTAREEWEAPPDEWWTTEEVLDEIDRLERETGLPPAALAAELSADIERIAAAEAQIAQAEADLRDAVSKERITAYGRRVGKEENAAIPALALSRRDRKITEAGNIIAGAGVPEWTDVQFRAEDVLAIWPEGREPASDAAPAADGPPRAAEPPAPPAKARGGRPPTYDWDALTREAIRAAILDGFENRAALAKHLREWVTANWKEQPDERTLQREIAKRCPSDLPER